LNSTERLISLYQQTSPTIRRRGRIWYPSMNRLLRQLAAEHDRPLAQVAAVCAITSANTQLLSNLRFTERILRGERTAGCYPKLQAPLIGSALSTRYPGRFVRGPKCRAFFEAIMGNTDALVLDRWSARAGGYHTVRRDLNVTVRRELDVAYREAAAVCGETVRSFQAIAWLHIRETTPNGRAVVPRYFDITRRESA
jgi:hypothetical protein